MGHAAVKTPGSTTPVFSTTPFSPWVFKNATVNTPGLKKGVHGVLPRALFRGVELLQKKKKESLYCLYFKRF